MLLTLPPHPLHTLLPLTHILCQYRYQTLVPLVECMILLDNHAEAESIQEDVVALSKIVHGGEHIHTLVGTKRLAMMKEKSNKWADAENLYKEAW